MTETRNTPPFFDRRVTHQGYTRTIALGKILPPDWRYVRIYVLRKTDKEVEILIRKLVGVNADALTHTNRKRG